MFLNRIIHFLRANAFALILVILIAAMLKHYYSISNPDDLKWLTTPLKTFVHCITGINFIYETGYGYVNFSHGIGIAQACVGINYMIAIFCMLSSSFIPAFKHLQEKLLFLFFSLFLSYICTIVVNSLRIITAIKLRHTQFRIAGISHEQIHRLHGILFYFSAMCVIFLIMQYFLKKLNHLPSSYRLPLIIIPFLWYLTIAVAVPLMNGALQSHRFQFIEHTAWILAISLIIAFFFKLVLRHMKKLNRIIY